MISTTTDSGANIFKAVSLLDSTVFKLPCAGHRLNLCVDDILKEKEVSEYEDEETNATCYAVKKFDELGKLKLFEIQKKEASAILKENRIRAEIKKTLASCRHVVGSFKHSSSLQNDLKNEQMRLNYKHQTRLIQDVATRWNSTYDMLDSLCSNKHALLSLSQKKINKTLANLADYLPSEEEFAMLNELCNLLQHLKELTVLLSEQK